MHDCTIFVTRKEAEAALTGLNAPGAKIIDIDNGDDGHYYIIALAVITDRHGNIIDYTKLI